MKPDRMTVTQFNQRRKFNWINLIAQQQAFRKKPLMLRLCILIADRFHTDRGCVEFSIDFAAEALDCDPSQVTRARQELVRLGWLKLTREATSSRSTYSANQYDLGGGPDAIDLANKSGHHWVARPHGNRAM